MAFIILFPQNYSYVKCLLVSYGDFTASYVNTLFGKTIFFNLNFFKVLLFKFKFKFKWFCFQNICVYVCMYKSLCPIHKILFPLFFIFYLHVSDSVKRIFNMFFIMHTMASCCFDLNVHTSRVNFCPYFSKTSNELKWLMKSNKCLWGEIVL